MYALPVHDMESPPTTLLKVRFGFHHIEWIFRLPYLITHITHFISARIEIRESLSIIFIHIGEIHTQFTTLPKQLTNGSLSRRCKCKRNPIIIPRLCSYGPERYCKCKPIYLNIPTKLQILHIPTQVRCTKLLLMLVNAPCKNFCVMYQSMSSIHSIINFKLFGLRLEESRSLLALFRRYIVALDSL